MLTDVKYTRDWQLGLKKNLQGLVVKPIIFRTQKLKFSVKDLMWVNAQFYVDMFTFTKEILNGNFIFCALICAGKSTEN